MPNHPNRVKTLPREGWWFSTKSGNLGYGDGRKIVIGEKLSVKGKLIICENALHGSFDPFDALQYAPGSILHKVLFSGARIEENDKVGSRSRTVLATREASAMLLHFARRQALSCASAWDMPAVVRQWLETGDENLRHETWSAVESVAGSVARSAARTAARSPARSAARSAARSPAWSAAWSAAASTAWSAAESVAESAARKAAESAAESAAKSAAWSAAVSAAESKYSNWLIVRIESDR